MSYKPRNQGRPPGGGHAWGYASRVPGGAGGDTAITPTKDGVPAVAPTNYYAPSGAQTVDMRHAKIIDPMTLNEVLMSFKPRDHGITSGLMIITGYGIFNDGLVEDDYSFLPTVNGVRVFPLHGNPNKNFRMSLGLAPDLSDIAIIPCELILQPDDEIIWRVTNQSAVETAMGVRMKGYVDPSQKVTQRRFGG